MRGLPGGKTLRQFGHEFRVIRAQIVSFADVVFQVEEQRFCGGGQKFPVAPADCGSGGPPLSF